MKYFYTFVICFLLINCFSFSKTQNEIDSLLVKYEKLPDSKEKVDKMYNLALDIFDDFPKLSLKLCETGIRISEKINYPLGKANNLRVKAISHGNLGDFPRALEFFYSSLEVYKKINDYEGQAKVYANIAIIFYTELNFDKALEYTQIAYRLHDSLGGETAKRGKARCLSNLGTIYRGNNQFDEALKSYTKALSLLDSVKDYKGMSIVYDNIAEIQFKMKDYKQAFNSIYSAIEYNKKDSSESGLSYNYNRLAMFYLELAEIEEQPSKKSELLSKCFDAIFTALSIAEKIGHHPSLRNIYSTLYLAYKQRGDFANALKYNELHNQIKDSLFTIDKSKVIANLDAKREIQIKQARIEILENQKAKDFFKFAFLVSLLLLIIAVIITISLKLKKKNIFSESLIKKLTEAVEQSANHIMITDTSGKIEYINNRFTEITGYTREDAIGKTPSILKSGVYDIIEYKLLWDTILNGEIWNSELINKRKSGELYWEKNVITPIFNEKGVLTNFVSIKEDITEKKKIQEKIEATNKMLKDILDAASEIAIISTNADGIINIFNTGAERILGYEADKIVGLECPLLFHLESEINNRMDEISSIVSKPLNKFDALVSKALSNGYEQKEWTYCRKDDIQLIVSVVIHPIISIDGILNGYLFIAQDITKRKNAEAKLIESEEQYRTLFESANDAILLLDSDIFTKCNKKTLELFKCSESEILGKTPSDFSPEFQEDGSQSEIEMYSKIKDALSGNGQYFEWTHKRSDGSLFYAEISLNRIELKNNLLVQAQVRDITERKIAEQKIKELNENLEQKVIERTYELNKALKTIEDANIELTALNENIASEARKLLELNEKLAVSENELRIANQTKDKFISIIAHDLKNPIGGIRSLLEMLNNFFDEYSKDELRRLMSSSLSATKKTYDLLEHLLTWAKSTKGSIEFNPHFNSIFESIEKVIEIVKLAADNKTIRISHSASINHIAFFDENYVNTILRNLITNSIKYSYENSDIKIDVSYDYSEDYVLITVADNGIGISEKAMSNLFKLDKIQTSVGTSKETGTGLGLILCKEFVERHSGKIWCESIEGAGSTFYFTLPKKQNE